MASLRLVLETLDGTGHHLTGPRRAVAEMVAARSTRFTADDIVAEAHQEGRHVGRATVFRTLELFETLGLVERIHLPTGEHAYVGCEPARHHHHIVCSRCGRDADIGDVGLRSLAEAIEAETGFLVDAHRVEFTGLCPACRSGAAPEPDRRAGIDA